MASKQPPRIDADDLARKISKQAIYERQLPRKFYQSVEVNAEGDEFAISLDGKPVRTPMKNAFSLPNEPLAQAISEEWLSQDEFINPDEMPLTRLANTAIDRVADRRDDILAEIVAYAGSDLLCYRASDPRELVSRHVEHWDPLLDWAKNALNAHFETVDGVVHLEQRPETLTAFHQGAEAHDAFALTGLHNIMTMTGSAIMALALVRGAISGEAAWRAAHVDEDWQIEQWGEDAEAKDRRELRHAEFMETTRFLELV